MGLFVAFSILNTGQLADYRTIRKPGRDVTRAISLLSHKAKATD